MALLAVQHPSPPTPPTPIHATRAARHAMGPASTAQSRLPASALSPSSGAIVALACLPEPPDPFRRRRRQRKSLKLFSSLKTGAPVRRGRVKPSGQKKMSDRLVRTHNPARQTVPARTAVGGRPKRPSVPIQPAAAAAPDRPTQHNASRSPPPLATAHVSRSTGYQPSFPDSESTMSRPSEKIGAPTLWSTFFPDHHCLRDKALVPTKRTEPVTL